MTNPEDPRPEAPPTRSRNAARAALRRLEGYFPPARLLWVGLAVLAGEALYTFANPAFLLPVLILPVAAVIVDLVFQRIRFPSLRIPDAALTTGLFLALLLPPVVPLAAGIAVTFAAIGLRHALRSGGRPWFNPAALGMLFATALFNQPVAWWGSTSILLTAGVGILLALRNRREWRLPAFFFLAFVPLTVFFHVLTAAANGFSIDRNVLFLAATDPTMLFFGLLMVPEPRSAPTLRSGVQPVYAVVIAAAAVFGPLIFPTLAPLIALLAANLGVVLFRMVRAAHPERSATRAASVARSARADRRWTVPTRAMVALAVLLMLAFAIPVGVPKGSTSVPLVSSGPPSGGGGEPGASGAAACLQDSSSIPKSTAQALHNVLGPAVLLSDNPSTGIVVFYDPVNHVTVTETDLNEDFGAAEFNGDDYTTSGCAPG